MPALGPRPCLRGPPLTGNLALRCMYWLRQASTPSSLRPKEVGRIALVELLQRGDLMAALSMVRPLKRLFPGAEVRVIHSKSCSGVADMLDGFAPLPVENSKDIRALVNWGLAHRNTLYDLTIAASPSHRNSLVALLLRSRARVGYFQRPRNTYAHRTYSVPVQAIGLQERSRFLHDGSIYDRGYRILSFLGACCANGSLGELSVRDLRPNFRRLDDNDRYARSFLERKHIRDFVVVHPFAGVALKQWPLTKFVSLFNGMADVRPDVFFVAIGAPSEIAELGLADIPSNCMVFPARTISDSAALIARASAFVGNDSGPAHIAYLLHVPALVLFGPTTPESAFPDVPWVRTLCADAPCAPCDLRRCPVRSDNCMNRISVRDVLETLSAVLQTTRQQAVKDVH